MFVRGSRREETFGKSVEGDTEMLKAMEDLVTEETRSGIFESIKKHEYIEVKKIL